MSRKLIASLVTLVLALTVAVTASAARAYVPYHVSRVASCNTSTRSVTSYVPLADAAYYYSPDYTYTETVKWSPDLWKYTSSGWVLWNGLMPWAYGAANNTGRLQPIWPNYYDRWWDSTLTRLVSEGTFNTLSSGYYAVKEYYNWQAASFTYPQWSVFGNGSAVCQIGVPSSVRPPPQPGGGGSTPAPAPTGERAGALTKCKKKFRGKAKAKKRKKCIKKAKKLPA